MRLIITAQMDNIFSLINILWFLLNNTTSYKIDKFYVATDQLMFKLRQRQLIIRKRPFRPNATWIELCLWIFHIESLRTQRHSSLVDFILPASEAWFVLLHFLFNSIAYSARQPLPRSTPTPIFYSNMKGMPQTKASAHQNVKSYAFIHTVSTLHLAYNHPTKLDWNLTHFVP